MKKQKRVLIVEDDRSLLEDYAEIITDAGYEVETTDNLMTALAYTYNIAFHVAIVDIALEKNDEHNQDGLTIIQNLRELNEGTEVVILSGQSNLTVAIEAYEKYGIAQYLEKGKKTPKDIINAVDTAFKKCNLKEYGAFHSLTAFLAQDSNPARWEYDCLSVLHPRGGVTGLNKFLTDLCGPFTPLLGLKHEAARMTVTPGGVSGRFWSRAIGEAVRLEGWSSGSRKSPVGEDASELSRVESGGVFGRAFAINDMDRDSFVPKN